MIRTFIDEAKDRILWFFDHGKYVLMVSRGWGMIVRITHGDFDSRIFLGDSKINNRIPLNSSR